MATRPVRLFGDPILRTAAELVTTFDKELRTLVKDLTDTLLAAPGSGLAAPQIGVGLRVFVFDIEDTFGHIVNPVLHFPTQEREFDEEGCLSLPGLTFDCWRMRDAVAHGQNVCGDPITLEGSARVARCFQHETDHLDGVIFIDRFDPGAKRQAMRAIQAADWSDATRAVVKASPHPLFGRAR